MREIPIKADASGKAAMSATVNGKQIRFNLNAVNAIGLKDKVFTTLAVSSDDENAKPDRLLIRNQHTSTPRPLGAQKNKWRDLNSEEVVRAAKLSNGQYPIEYDEENGVHYIAIDPEAAERTTFEKSAKRVKEQNQATAQQIKDKRAAAKAEKEAKAGK